MIYNTLDQYSIYQRYLNYTDYNKLMLYSAGTATTTEAGEVCMQNQLVVYVCVCLCAFVYVCVTVVYVICVSVLYAFCMYECVGNLV